MGFNNRLLQLQENYTVRLDNGNYVSPESIIKIYHLLKQDNILVTTLPIFIFCGERYSTKIFGDIAFNKNIFNQKKEDYIIFYYMYNENTYNVYRCCFTNVKVGSLTLDQFENAEKAGIIF